jgi:hypothetical protein
VVASPGHENCSYATGNILLILCRLPLPFRCDICISWKIFPSPPPSPPPPNGATALGGPGPHRGFMITLRHTALGRTPLDEGSARRRDLYLTTQNTQQETDIHAPSGIRTRNPSKRAAAVPRRRPAASGIGFVEDLVLVIPRKCV